MPEVAKLKVVPKVDDTQDCLEKFDSVTKEMREWISTRANCGFVVTAYARDGKGGMSSIANYRLADPMDAYAIPEFIKSRIENIRDAD